MSEIQSCFKRYEKKYLITKEQYREMIRGMMSYMKPDEHPVYSVNNIYYDTENFDLIRTSLEKPVYKEKLRMRSYGIPQNGDTVFVELKKKYDGVVYKRRITMDVQDAVLYLAGLRKGDGSQISREIDYFRKLYKPTPKVLISYDREAYSAADGSELRITFDTALRARSYDLDLRLGTYGVLFPTEDICLMEIKIPGTAPMWLAELLSDNGVFPTSFSKYGTYYKHFILSGDSSIISKEVSLSA